MQTYDVVIIGAGHKWADMRRLSRHGWPLRQGRRAPRRGGRERLSPKSSIPASAIRSPAYTVSLLNPKIIADLHLVDHGLKIVERRAQKFSSPTPDGQYLLAAEPNTERNIAKFSYADAARYGAFPARRSRRNAEPVARNSSCRRRRISPAASISKTLSEVLKAGRLGNRLRRLFHGKSADPVRSVSPNRPADLLDGWF